MASEPVPVDFVFDEIVPVPDATGDPTESAVEVQSAPTIDIAVGPVE
jgi:hypothetical protein